MPEKSKRPVRFANLAHLFAKISQQDSMSDELCEIATTHGRAIEAEFVALKKTRKNKKKVQQHSRCCSKALNRFSSMAVLLSSSNQLLELLHLLLSLHLKNYSNGIFHNKMVKPLWSQTQL